MSPFLCFLLLLTAALCIARANAFVTPSAAATAALLDHNNNNNNKKNKCSFALHSNNSNKNDYNDVNNEEKVKLQPVKGFFQEIGDMFANMDDVMDDFFMKRMGNGEQFYGKRKFKPSGKVEGGYNGMGLSDKLRIDIARVRKEEFLEERERKRAAQAENRN